MKNLNWKTSKRRKRTPPDISADNMIKSLTDYFGEIEKEDEEND